MTTRKIKISRQGLTRCPSCKAHIQVAISLADTVCPFCQTILTESVATRSGLDRLMGSGRSALIAASLLGMPAMGACDDGGGDPSQPVADAGPEVQPTPVYGVPAQDVVADVEPDQSPDQPVYGMPADAFDPGPDVEGDAEPDEGMAVPVYGMPADEGPQ